jgi:hypothetical protein
MSKLIKLRVIHKNEIYYLSNNQISELHLKINNAHWSLFDGRKNNPICTDRNGVLNEFTGFTDTSNEEIYDGDNIGDQTVVDGVMVRSRQRVFWNAPTGSWHLDQSFDQQESYSSQLWQELEDFKYKISVK